MNIEDKRNKDHVESLSWQKSQENKVANENGKVGKEGGKMVRSKYFAGEKYQWGYYGIKGKRLIKL